MVSPSHVFMYLLHVSISWWMSDPWSSNIPRVSWSNNCSSSPWYYRWNVHRCRLLCIVVTGSSRGKQSHERSLIHERPLIHGRHACRNGTYWWTLTYRKESPWAYSHGWSLHHWWWSDHHSWYRLPWNHRPCSKWTPHSRRILLYLLEYT